MQSTIELTYPNHGVHWGRDRYKDASLQQYERYHQNIIHLLKYQRPANNHQQYIYSTHSDNSFLTHNKPSSQSNGKYRLQPQRRIAQLGWQSHHDNRWYRRPRRKHHRNPRRKRSSTHLLHRQESKSRRHHYLTTQESSTKSPSYIHSQRYFLLAINARSSQCLQSGIG